VIRQTTAVAVTRSRLGALEMRIARAVDALYRWLSRNRVTRFPWAVIQTFSDGQGALLSGSMAYYTFLSLLPLLMIAGFAVGAVSHGDPGVQAALVTAVERVFPGISGEEILTQLIRARVAFGVVGLVTLSYAASGFVGALTASLNRMWEVPRGRNPIGQKVLNILIVGLLGAVLLASVSVTIWAAYWSRRALGNDARAVIQGIDFVGGPLSFFLVLLLLYRVLPAKSMSWRSQAPGAISGAVTIELLKRGFAFWADHSAGVAVLPRSLVSVVLLLVWLGFLGQAILYGAAMNVVADRRRRGTSLFPPTAIDDTEPEP
jgi:membrane protein